jgi:hypothetical protein
LITGEIEMSQYHREVIKFLEGWGAGPSRPYYERNSQTGHPKIWFEWKGEKKYVTVATTPGDINVIHATIRQLKNMLGDPIISATKPKRSLQSMTDELNGNIQNGTPKASPVVEKIMADVFHKHINGETKMSIGQIALYKADIGDFQIRFYIPSNISEEAKLINERIKIRRTDKFMWEIYRSTDGRLFRGGEFSIREKELYEGFKIFGRSPAEYLVVDGVVLVQLIEESIAPVIERKASERRVQKTEETISSNKLVDLPAPNYLTKMEQLLKSLEEIESNTFYTLKKDSTTKEWVFSAPAIRLEKK